MKLVLIYLATIVAFVNADVYMHSPRGSNNRLNEANRDRTNGNRLFDSQNNNRGGSNVGSIKGEQFYAGSVLPLEWTNQHTCGTPTEAGQPNNDCNVVWEYMCDQRVRDGTSTNTIPDNNNNCANNNCDTDQKYGRHESYNFYKLCEMTQRNTKLYTANQDVQGDRDNNNGQDSPNGIADAGAIYTRQNPNGDRRGYECPEERDHYPYWRGSPWVGIAVLTNTPERCEAYTVNSPNITPRAACEVPNNVLAAKQNTKGWIPSDQAACEQSGYTWNPQAVPAHNQPAPVCIQSFATRDNQLGNTDGATGEVAGFNTMVNWTIPSAAGGENCVVRVRYNVSSSENGSNKLDATDPTLGAYGWASLSSVGPGIDYTSNQNPPGNNQNNNKPAKLDVWSQFGLPASAVREDNRDYAMRNNPQSEIFDIAQNAPRFQLAINTNQFFRTFEDRTHDITLGVTYPADIPKGTPIHNVNVRGKRGNIVQTYPGTEYDHNPNRLMIRSNDYIHFQWTGSDTNPANNAGEGNAGEDRHNVVALRKRAYQEGGVIDNPATKGTLGVWSRNYPTKNINQDNFLGWPERVLDTLAVKGIKNSRVYLKPLKVDAAAAGTHNYMSTRNNNFTNRSQKAQVTVSNTYLSTARMGYSGGHVFSGRNYLRVHAGSLSKQHKVIFTGGPSNDEWESDWVNVEVYAEGQKAAHAFHLRENKENTIDLHMAYTPSPFTKPALYRTVDGVTEAVDAEFQHEHGVALAKVNQGGMHVIKSHLNVPLIIGLGASTLFILGAVVAGSVAACRKQQKEM